MNIYEAYLALQDGNFIEENKSIVFMTEEGLTRKKRYYRIPGCELEDIDQEIKDFSILIENKSFVRLRQVCVESFVNTDYEIIPKEKIYDRLEQLRKQLRNES